MSTCSGATKRQPLPHQQVRKHVKRQQDVKENLQKPDNPSWKKKERLFDRQRKSLDDALSHVDRLQKEATKKDRELVEWQLKEKETKAELMRLEDKLKRSRISSKLEPRKLLLEIPALRETLRSLKAASSHRTAGFCAWFSPCFLHLHSICTY